MNTTRNAAAAARHVKRYAGAKLDRWEADYVCGGLTMKRDAKKNLTRALRRSERAAIREQE